MAMGGAGGAGFKISTSGSTTIWPYQIGQAYGWVTNSGSHVQDLHPRLHLSQPDYSFGRSLSHCRMLRTEPASGRG